MSRVGQALYEAAYRAAGFSGGRGKGSEADAEDIARDILASDCHEVGELALALAVAVPGSTEFIEARYNLLDYLGTPCIDALLRGAQEDWVESRKLPVFA